MKQIWSINGRFLAQPQTGVQRYASEIVRALDTALCSDPLAAARFDIELLVPADAQHTLNLKSIPTRVVAGGTGHQWEQIALPRSLQGGLLSLCNTGPLIYRHQIVCIHDANTRSIPQSYSLPFRLLYRTLQPGLCRRVCAITTVSAFSASELVRFHIACPGKISVVPNGHEHVLRWKPHHTPETSAASGPNTVVLIGSLAPHKNVGVILSIADRLAAAGLRIAVVGVSDPRIFSGTGKSFDAANISWLGRVDDEALAALLRDSLCLCFPSLTEGFGLPALEAMALGCPVITTDRASLPEVCGNAALYASPLDSGAWFDAINRLRHSPSLAAEMALSGREQARHFSWDTSARHYLELMTAADRDSVSTRLSQPGLASRLARGVG